MRIQWSSQLIALSGNRSMLRICVLKPIKMSVSQMLGSRFFFFSLQRFGWLNCDQINFPTIFCWFNDYFEMDAANDAIYIFNGINHGQISFFRSANTIRIRTSQRKMYTIKTNIADITFRKVYTSFIIRWQKLNNNNKKPQSCYVFRV